MIVLIFKRTDFQPIIIFNYLCSEIFNTSEVSDIIEVKRLTDRITALVSKLELEMLNENFDQLYLALNQSVSKEKLLKGICDQIKGRKTKTDLKKEFIQKVANQ